MVRIIDIIAQFNREVFDFDILEFGESPQVAHCDARDGGHFDWHTDIVEGPIAAQRKLTLVVQLSDPADYTGGALELMPDTQPRQAPRARTGDAVSQLCSAPLHTADKGRAGLADHLGAWPGLSLRSVWKPGFRLLC